jgi:hypothetical protein
MKHLTLELKGELFRSAYTVYVVEIRHQTKGRFFYVGQTGDSHYLMARSPFYRMGGHFEYRKSTQNQIFKGICDRLDIRLKDAPKKESDAEKEARKRTIRSQVEAFLLESTVTYHLFPVKDFSYDNEDREEHQEKRHSTLVIETALLKLFDNTYGDQLLNKGLVTLKREPNPEEQGMIQEIVEKLRTAGILIKDEN